MICGPWIKYTVSAKMKTYIINESMGVTKPREADSYIANLR